MAKQTLNTIKNWFKTGLKPTQQQFWDTWDSFWHKDQVIPASSIENLDARFDEKADEEAFQSHLSDNHAHNIDSRLANKASINQLEAEVTARADGDNYLQSQVDELFSRPSGSLEVVRALDNKILGAIDFNGNTGLNVASPEENGQVANKEYADQKEINAKNYADLVATDVLRYAGDWDAGTGQYPIFGTGTDGNVKRGDSFEINVEGIIDGKEYEVGDQLRAKVNAPGQISANWGSGQVNSQQATETRIGIAKVATEAQAIAKLSDTEMMTPAKIGATIAAEKKWFKFQIALTGETEQAILMEYSGQINSSLLGGCNTLKLKNGVDALYPNDNQVYPFVFNAGDRVFFTFNYDDVMFAKCNVILKGKYN